MSSRASHAEEDALSRAEAHAALSEAPIRIAALSLLVTTFLLVLKLVLGIMSDSIAVLSDAVDSATDLVGGTAALVSVRISRQPADEKHPFGHGKIEAVSASVAATIIAIGGGLITYGALRRLIEGSPDIDVGVGLIAMIIAALANVVMAFFMRREAKRSESMALAAEATHLTTNIVQAGAIILGLVLVYITDEPALDAVTALLLAAYMGYTAIGLVRTALEDIMDASLPDDEVDGIREVLDRHAGSVRGYHNLRTRRSGATRHVDMHLLFDAGRTVEEVHTIADQIAAEIEGAFPGTIVVIHPEPDLGREAAGAERIILTRD
jgi:cation diffusion facilitator family transporter